MAFMWLRRRPCQVVFLRAKRENKPSIISRKQLPDTSKAWNFTTSLFRHQLLKRRLKARIKELEREKKEMEELRQEHASLQERHSALQKDFNEVNGKSARRFAEIKELEKKYGKLEKEHLRLERSKRR